MQIPERWLTFVAVCFIALICLVAYPVFAQDHSGHRAQDMPLHHQFYKTWTMPDNRSMSCCNDKDCEPSASKLENGSWYGKRGDEWIMIPAQKIERERDSPDGQSHLCAQKVLGSWMIYCFLPASGS